MYLYLLIWRLFFIFQPTGSKSLAKNRYNPKPLDEVMGGWSDKLNQYGQKSAQAAQLQTCLVETLGPILSKKCRVAHYREGTLTIEAASATLATRLNFLKMDILSAFRKAGVHDCALVKITTNPEAQQRLNNTVESPSTAYKANRNMSQATGEQLLALAESAPPSLKAKLEKLAKHATPAQKK
ncbi:DUF721 domain-containing protein [Pseudoalteromonas sp. PS5]|nr:DUF721 domain-containing protein [Pseudoalteromonas sp. PS5]